MTQIVNKIPLVTLMASVIDRIRAEGVECFDQVPLNQALPFSYVEVIRQEPANTKTFMADRYILWIHTWADGSSGSKKIAQSVDKVQDALLTEITVPTAFRLVSQSFNGLIQLFQEETKEKHAVQELEMLIAYGCRTK